MVNLTYEKGKEYEPPRNGDRRSNPVNMSLESEIKVN